MSYRFKAEDICPGNLLPEQVLAANVILQVDEDIRRHNAYLTGKNFQRRKRLDYGRRKTLEKIAESQSWIHSKSTEKYSMLYWASYLSDYPEVIQRNVIELFQIGKPGEPVIVKNKQRFRRAA